MDIVERLRDMQGKKYRPEWSEWVQKQCNEAATEIERLRQRVAELEDDPHGGDPIPLSQPRCSEIDRLRSGASAYDALLRANGPAWLQQVSGGSYMDAVADCKRAGWWPEPSNGWPDTDAERSAGG